MAGLAIRWRIHKSGGVTPFTIHLNVRTRQYKSGAVVVKSVGRVSSWVAGQTGLIMVPITGYAGVFLIGIRIEVANRAAEFFVVTRIGMAIATFHPFSLMLSRIDRKILSVVVKGGWHPDVLSMTTGAVC